VIDRVWKKEYTMLIHKTLWIKAFCVGQDAFSRSRESAAGCLEKGHAVCPESINILKAW